MSQVSSFNFQCSAHLSSVRRHDSLRFFFYYWFERDVQQAVAKKCTYTNRLSVSNRHNNEQYEWPPAITSQQD